MSVTLKEQTRMTEVGTDQGAFELSVKITSANQATITLIGIVGADINSSEYYVICWQNPTIGGELIKKQELTFSGTSGETTFDNLNLTEFQHTFALCLNYSAVPATEYYPVSVTSEKGSFIEPKTYTSDNPTTLTKIESVGQALRVTYNIPNGNITRVFPQYVVLTEGTMNNHYGGTNPPPVITSMIAPQDTTADLTLDLDNRLIVGSWYNVAYIMGELNGQPDLTKLVGWTNFIA